MQGEDSCGKRNRHVSSVVLYALLAIQEYTPVAGIEVEGDHLCGGELLLECNGVINWMESEISSLMKLQILL